MHSGPQYSESKFFSRTSCHLIDSRLNSTASRLARKLAHKQSSISGIARLIVLISMFGTLACMIWAQGISTFPVVTQSVLAQVQSVTVTVQKTGVLGSIQVMTQGVTGADFTDAAGGTCALGQTYLASQTCTVNVQFKPKYPGEHHGGILLSQSNGDTIATQFLYGVSKGPLGLIIPGLTNTVAGDGSWIYRQDGVAATSASIFLPMGEVVDAAGNLYLSDSNNNRIRRVDAATGLISTVAGIGLPGFNGDNGTATTAMISNPSAVVLDGAGNLYFADSGNHAIRMVNLNTGIIVTVAGTGGQQGYSGDLGPATAARLNLPYGLALDAAQNLYIADTGNNAIRKVDLLTGIITTVAGNGTAGYAGDAGAATSAILNSPWGITIAGNGSLYIADLTNNRIRRIDTSGTISTVAGTGSQGFSGDDGSALTATLNSPAAVAVDPAGNVYIADAGNNRIRKVSASIGIIQTIAGTASESMGGDGGNSDAATFYGPYSLFLDGPGNLYIGDMFHNRIRKISSNAASLLFDTIRVSRISPPQKEILENDGNADLNVATISFDSNSALDPATTTCALKQIIAADASCLLGVEFAPTTVGDLIQGSITLGSDAANMPGVITLAGKVLTVDPTSTVLSSDTNPSAFGAAVTLTAQVKTAGSSVTGTVQFLDGSAVIGTGTLNAGGVATFTTLSLALGQHQLTAAYSGDSSNASSTSPTLTQTVKQATALALGSDQNPVVVTQRVAFTATLSGGSNATGSIVFSDGGNVHYWVARCGIAHDHCELLRRCTQLIEPDDTDADSVTSDLAYDRWIEQR
jgi:sugar lactone lactonase YvrE